MSQKVADAVTALVGALKDLDNDERMRAVRAALTIFGQTPDVADASFKKAAALTSSAGEGGDEAGRVGVSSAGLEWMKKNGISRLQLEELFDFANGDVHLIGGDPIGNGRAERARNTYILTGLAALLSTGQSAFTDEAARQNCSQLGCYDHSNHVRYVKDIGNRLAGSKNGGWRLTGPGTKAAADLVRSATKAES